MNVLARSRCNMVSCVDFNWLCIFGMMMMIMDVRK